LFPTIGPLPVTWQTRAMMVLQNLLEESPRFYPEDIRGSSIFCD